MPEQQTKLAGQRQPRRAATKRALFQRLFLDFRQVSLDLPRLQNPAASFGLRQRNTALPTDAPGEVTRALPERRAPQELLLTDPLPCVRLAMFAAPGRLF